MTKRSDAPAVREDRRPQWPSHSFSRGGRSAAVRQPHGAPPRSRCRSDEQERHRHHQHRRDQPPPTFNLHQQQHQHERPETAATFELLFCALSSLSSGRQDLLRSLVRPTSFRVVRRSKSRSSTCIICIISTTLHPCQKQLHQQPPHQHQHQHGRPGAALWLSRRGGLLIRGLPLHEPGTMFVGAGAPLSSHPRVADRSKNLESPSLRPDVP